MRGTRFAARAVWPLLIAGLAALLIVDGPSLARAWSLNRQAVTTAKLLAEEPETGATPEAMPAACPDYPTGLRLLYGGALAPAEVLSRVERLAGCWPPERVALLAGRRAEALWALGRHREACSELAAVSGAPSMLALAERSSRSDDWDAVATYLECLPALASGDTWISPWIVARLYFGLGQHLEKEQDTDGAIAAYNAAGAWHPTVWAAPYQRQAQLLWGRGDHQPAINLLVDALARSTDATAEFHLWRTLGQFWNQRMDQFDALCAYQKAADLMDRLPAGSLTEDSRRALLQELEALQDTAAETRPCFSDYPALQRH